MKNLLSVALITVIVLSSLVFVNNVIASTSVTGIIYSDATWTKVNSPYVFEGPVAVNSGVTLTIEPGVTINVNDHYLQINGTLNALGADNDKINFNCGSIIFTSVSSGGSIQNAVLSDSISVSVSVKITKNSIHELDVNGGSSAISHNSMT